MTEDNDIKTAPYEDKIFDKPRARYKRRLTATVSVVLVIVLAVICALIVKSCGVFDSYIVDGSSMYPTLNGGSDDLYDGDTLYLDCVAKIKRNDIIVFHWDWNGNDKELVKRVIGVGGDKVEIYGGIVYLNGTALKEDYAVGQTYNLYDGDLSALDATVPDGYIFCLGDNREHSSDSREPSIGFVPLEKVVGKCFMIVSSDGRLRLPK